MGCGNSKDASVSASEKPGSAKGAQNDGPKGLNFKPIHSAIRWNKPLDEIDRLLDSPEAVNSVDTANGNRPIHIAAQNGHFATVQLLIKKGADLNVQNQKGNTPIHMAIGYDYYDCAMLLIEAKGDPLMKNEAGHAGQNGIDGDKTLGLAALISARNGEDVMNAFNLCEERIGEVVKASFVAAGLKTKKTLGPEWGTAHQDRFKSIIAKLE